MDQDIERLRGAFFEEASDFLEIIERGLLVCERGGATPDDIHAVFRATHSLKGAARTFGYDTLGGLAHALEDLLDRLRSQRVAATPALCDLLLHAADLLRGLLAAARDGAPMPPDVEATREALRRAAHGDASTSAPPTRQLSITVIPDADCLRRGADPASAIRTLDRLGTITRITVALDELPALADLDPTTCYTRWRLQLTTAASDDAIRRQLGALVSTDGRIEFCDDAPAPSRAQMARAATSDAASIRVAIDKVDRVINLVGEVVIAQSMMAHLLANFRPDRLTQLHEALAEMARNTRELQERVMAVRMLPVATVFSRIPRLVRDLAGTFGKEIMLETVGEDTELDKSVAEQLADPLMHLVRNAADHGLERPDERRSIGKPPTGTITLNAYHQSGKLVIEVRDDGRGLDTARIRAKAIANGLLDPTDDRPDDAVHALIFEPGFSTADAVSEVSGRGVGMDVVKRNVDALGGTITIHSTPGVGTCFRIRLPLTLAIIDGLSMRVGSETFLLPLVAIMESIRPRPSEVQSLAGQAELVTVRGECLPLLRLHRLFGITPRVTDPCRGLVVLVEHDGQRLALLVDELLGQQQVVVKSLEANYRRIDGLAGATILGQGTVALILDVPGLVALARRQSAPRAITPPLELEGQPP